MGPHARRHEMSVIWLGFKQDLILAYTEPANSVFCDSYWLLKPGIAFCYSPPSILLDFVCKFCLISHKKGTIWCWLSTGLVHTKTIIHLSVGEEW